MVFAKRYSKELAQAFAVAGVPRQIKGHRVLLAIRPLWRLGQWLRQSRVS